MSEITREKIIEMLLLDFDVKRSLNTITINNKRCDLLYDLYDEDKTDDDLNVILDRYYTVLYTIFIMDRYSLVADYLLNRNKNIEEKDILNFKQMMNIKKDSSNSKNIDVVKKLRYAYNHNDDLSDNKFKVYDDCSYEVNIDNSNFIVSFNYEDIIKMTNYLMAKTKNKHYLCIEGIFDFHLTKDIDEQIDNIYVDYYPLKNSFPINKIEGNLSTESLDRSSRTEVVRASNDNKMILRSQLKQEVEDGGGVFNDDDYRYRLDDYQKEKLKSILKRLKKIDLYVPFKENIAAYMNYAVQSVLPTPYAHSVWFEDMSYALSEYYDFNFSYIEILDRSFLRINNEIKKIERDRRNGRNIDSRILFSELRYFLFTSDLHEVKKYAKINIVKYLIMNYIKDESIYVDNEKCDVKRIRNSLVHYRWFSGTYNYVVFYDALPNHEKLYDFKFCQKIDINLLLEECSKIYLKNKSN